MPTSTYLGWDIYPTPAGWKARRLNMRNFYEPSLTAFSYRGIIDAIDFWWEENDPISTSDPWFHEKNATPLTDEELRTIRRKQGE